MAGEDLFLRAIGSIFKDKDYTNPDYDPSNPASKKWRDPSVFTYLHSPERAEMMQSENRAYDNAMRNEAIREEVVKKQGGFDRNNMLSAVERMPVGSNMFRGAYGKATNPVDDTSVLGMNTFNGMAENMGKHSQESNALVDTMLYPQLQPTTLKAEHTALGDIQSGLLIPNAKLAQESANVFGKNALRRGQFDAQNMTAAEQAELDAQRIAALERASKEKDLAFKDKNRTKTEDLTESELQRQEEMDALRKTYPTYAVNPLSPFTLDVLVANGNIGQIENPFLTESEKLAASISGKKPLPPTAQLVKNDKTGKYEAIPIGNVSQPAIGTAQSPVQRTNPNIPVEVPSLGGRYADASKSGLGVLKTYAGTALNELSKNSRNRGRASLANLTGGSYMTESNPNEATTPLDVAIYKKSIGKPLTDYDKAILNNYQ